MPDYLLSILEAKAIAASGRMKEWRITPMTHRANVLKLWVRRPERAHWYEAGDAIGDFCTAASPETVLITLWIMLEIPLTSPWMKSFPH